jgi:hypothetical protein
MDLNELDEKLDSLPIRKQLELLAKTINEAKKKVEIANLFWERVLAAEDLLNPQEAKLFDSAADALIHIRSLVGCRQAKRRKR